MICLRCHRETDNQQNFCSACLQSMEQYPVNSETLIQLPRPRSDEKQSGKKRVISAAEQLTRMRRLLQWMIAISAVLLILFGVVTALLIKEYQTTIPYQQPMGRNYSVTIIDTES